MTTNLMTTESEMLTICHLVQDASYGGVESLIADLVEETAPELEHQVCYLSEHDEGVDRLRDAGATVAKLDIPIDSPRSCFNPRSYLPIAQYLRSNDIDVLHTHYPLYVHILGRIAAAVSGVERVCGSYHNPRSDFHPVMQAGEFGTRVLADATVGVSKQVEQSFDVPIARELPGHSPTGTIYNGIPVETFASDVESVNTPAVRKSFGLTDETLVFLSVGRYDQQKRQVDLIEASAHLDLEQEWHLFLVGHGPLEETLREKVASLGLEDRVTITGRVESVVEYYAVGDVFVSASAYEGFGIVFVEAMAARLPVVATAVPGALEVVADDHTGVLVPAASPSALASEMERFSDADRRSRFGRRGYRRAVTEFDISTTAQDYAEIYRGSR